MAYLLISAALSVIPENSEENIKLGQRKNLAIFINKSSKAKMFNPLTSKVNETNK